jgi:hypothetical protein
MRIREENCNLILLIVVTLVVAGIAGGASLLGFSDTPVRLADQTNRSETIAATNKQLIYVSDQPAVRVVGAPFVPNTNPRER